jgi:nucleoside-diphosphate kinase
MKRTLSLFIALFVFASFSALAAEETATFSMVKPSAVQDKHIGAILNKIEEAGLKLGAIRMARLTQDQAKAFYKEHEGKPFFASLVEKMTSGPVVLLVVKGEDAQNTLRKVIGATNPEKAEPNTIRALYGKNITENAIHASDSPESAKREIAFFFTQEQIVN